MPTGYVTKNFVKLETAFQKGYTTASLQGSARSSKTFSVIQWLINRCISVPGTTVSIVRATLPAIKRSVFRDFIDILNAWGVYNSRNLNKSDFVYYFDNGSWVEFFSCENEQKLRGPKRQILFVNEANEISELEWQQLQMRTTLFSILDYNPSFSEEHWINQVNQERKTCFWISTYKDNPFLEQRVIDEIESLQWKNPSLWQVYGLGKRAMVEGLVFPKFEIVNYMPTETMRRRYGGQDLGYTNDPSAGVEVRIYGKDLYINELFYRTQMLTSDLVREWKKLDWSPKIISESADPRLIDELYNAGLDIWPVHKYAGSIQAGIMKMQEFNIKITKQSLNVIKEFRNYTYRRDKDGKWLAEPIDAFNHCFTADTLVNTQRGLVCIDKLLPNDLALTSNGYRPIRHLFNQGCREVWRVRFCFANFAVEIEATPDHKFKTTKGWKQLKDLKETDVLYLCKCSTEKNIGSTPASGISAEEQNDCIVSCGNFTMEKFLKDMPFITKTKTLRIMKSAISNLWKNTHTYLFMRKSMSLMNGCLQRCARIWQKLLRQQKSGTTPRKDGNGTANTLNSWQQNCNIENISASAADGSIIPKWSHRTKPVSVQTNVSPNGAEVTISTTKQECANGAEKSLRSINTQRKDFVAKAALENIIILKISRKPTFDIEVDGEHEFFANGILVHNCIDATRYVILEEILGANAGAMSSAQILGLTDD